MNNKDVYEAAMNRVNASVHRGVHSNIPKIMMICAQIFIFFTAIYW